LNECEPGQRLRLGKAVIEFVGFEIEENRKYIKFITSDRKDKKHGTKTVYRSPMNNLFYLLEKTEGEVTTDKRWKDSKRIVEKKIEEPQNSTIKSALAKRTALKRSIVLLTAKNNFKEFVEELKINEIPFEDVLAYGEITGEATGGFKLYNKGRLDGVPAISISAKVDDIASAIKECGIADKIYSVFSTIDKMDDLINNKDALIKCLKKNIPFIAFVSETKYEYFHILSSLGFEFWHWSPLTLQNEIFIRKEVDADTQPLFGKISSKVSKAALADFETKTVRFDILKSIWKNINHLNNLVEDGDTRIRKIVRQLIMLQFRLQAIFGKVSIDSEEKNFGLLLDIKDSWESQFDLYEGQDIAFVVTNTMNQFEYIINEKYLPKIEVFSKTLDEIPDDSSAIILVAEKNEYVNEFQEYYSDIYPSLKIRVMKTSDFYAQNDIQADFLLVSWFSKQDYIKIKQSYCYKKMIFVLYDFEDNWRKSYIKHIEKCLPYENMKNIGVKIGWHFDEKKDIFYDTNIVSDLMEDEDYTEIDNYSFQRNIIRSVVKSETVNENSVDSIECVPILFSGDYIGYFHPKHKLFELRDLLLDENKKPVKKEARKLCDGDIILVRQSGRDIIKEKADELLKLNGMKKLREISSVWKRALSIYSQGKSLEQVCEALKGVGAVCSIQQVKYWIYGDTICPEKKEVISAIAKLSSPEDFQESVDAVYNAGEEIKGYHIKAGQWLTKELKSRTNEIRQIIYNSGSTAKGEIEGVGDVAIYTVEEVFEKQYISKSRLNKMEELD